MITIEELRRVPLFAALPDDEAETLAARLADVRLREGDWLIHEGELPSFFMTIEGSLEVRKIVHGVIEREAPVDRPARLRGSRITWAFRRGCPATSSAGAHCSRESSLRATCGTRR
jgi:hypothetical protein